MLLPLAVAQDRARGPSQRAHGAPRRRPGNYPLAHAGADVRRRGAHRVAPAPRAPRRSRRGATSLHPSPRHLLLPRHLAAGGGGWLVLGGPRGSLVTTPPVLPPHPLATYPVLSCIGPEAVRALSWAPAQAPSPCSPVSPPPIASGELSSPVRLAARRANGSSQDQLAPQFLANRAPHVLSGSVPSSRAPS